jgi:uncharacterized protein
VDISPTVLSDIALGAALLGTGGGGDPYIGMLMARHALEQYGDVRLLDPGDLDDDDLVIPTAMMGAPTVMVEKLPRGDEVIKALRALESYLGTEATATMSIEAGGLNSTTPIGVAAQAGIPLVDADGMGRAFPEIQMVVPTIHGARATPMAIADEKGNTVLLETIDNFWTETFSRSVTIDMGCTAYIALYALTGRQVKEATIHRTISLAASIGKTIRETQREHGDVVKSLCRQTGGFQIFTGKVVDVNRRTERGFARGDATLQGVADDTGRTLQLQFQNEHLIAIIDDEPVVTVPDLITVLDVETGEPITTEGLRYGFRVAVVAIPCADAWRTEAGLELVGPGYFGYDVPFVPVEERLQEEE